MAAYCGNCGAKLNEKDEFCGNCGAAVPKENGAAKKRSGSESGKYTMIGIAVVAVAVIFVGSLLLKGGGKADDPAGATPAESTVEETEDDTLSHLRPWMGDWILDREVNPDHPMILSNYDNEGYYSGDILRIEHLRGLIHVDEEYIDFSNLTKNQKDRFPVSALEYSVTDYGADAFTDTNNQIRFVFYDHFKTYDGSEDYGEILHIQAYVGHDDPEIIYIGNTPLAASHSPAPDGWAVDDESFTRLE